MDEPKMQPDTGEVLQQEPAAVLPVTPVPVVVAGPVRTQPLPRKSGVGRTVNVTTTPVMLLPADPHRALLRIRGVGSSGSVVVGFSRSDINDNSSTANCVLLAAGPTWFDITATQEVWVASLDGTVTQVTYYRENWAQG